MTFNAKRIIVFIVTALMLTVTAATVSAQAAQPYIEINNRNISITRTEQPQIVAQFGNRGQETLTNVRVSCFWNGDIRFVAGSAQNGPFASSQFVPPSSGNPPTVFYPAVGGAGISLPAGQNFNVGLNIRMVTAEGVTGPRGDLTCRLEADGGVNILSNTVTVNVR